MLKIGDFSKLSRISIRMLRHYDEIGLLVPKSIDETTGYRYYAEDQLPAAGRIAGLKDMGFGLAAISGILKSAGDPPALAVFLSAKRAELQAEAAEISRRILLLDSAVQRLRKDGNMMNVDVTLKTLPERTVASVRKVIPAYDQEGILWETLIRETAPLHIRDGQACHALAIFHDQEYKEADVDVEVQKSVAGTYQNTQNVVFKTEPPVLIASATYQGSYDKVNEVNQAVANWVRDNSYDFAGHNFFIYHVSPHETENPDEMVTEVCYPVRKK